MLVNQNFLSGLTGAGAMPGKIRMDGMDLETSMPLSFENEGGMGEAGKAQNSFADMLSDAVQAVEGHHHQALQLGSEFALGNQQIDPHQVMIAVAKAETELHLTSAVTTRVAQGYQTLMNMQI